jgi:hypothetical protein
MNGSKLNIIWRNKHKFKINRNSVYGTVYGGWESALNNAKINH